MSVKNYKQYFCEPCNYKTTRKDSFNKHIECLKHIMNCGTNKNYIKPILEKKYKCSFCNKMYSHRQSIHRHKIKCEIQFNYKDQINEYCNNDNTNTNTSDSNQLEKLIVQGDKDKDEYKDLIKVLIEQNNNLQSVIKDMIPKIGNNNTVINNNNKFNMMLFLEQQCKSAPTMKDYIAGLKIQVSDLLHTKDKGIVNGITNVFLNSLRQLDIYERPIHCTDMKRQTLYIKDSNTWLQGEESRKIISDAIQEIQAKHTKTIPEWEKLHPEWPSNDNLTEDYMKMVKYSTQFIDENSNDENKIIRAIAKEVIIDKKQLQIED